MNIKKLFENEELFKKYTDKEFEKVFLKSARRLSLSIAIFSLIIWIINLNIFPPNPILTIIGESTRVYQYNFFIFTSFFLLTSYNSKLKKISYIPLFISFLILTSIYFSYFGLFGFDNLVNIASDNILFELYQITFTFIFMISIGRIISHTFTLYDNIFYCF